MRRKRNVLFAAAVMSVLLAALVAAASDDRSDLAARAVTWQKAFNSGDLKGVAALYAEDAMRLPYQRPALTGRASIQENLKATRDAGVAKIQIEVKGAESQGNMAWGHGTYVLTNAGGETVQEGKWMNVSTKIDGQWFIVCDIWNTDAPETTADTE